MVAKPRYLKVGWGHRLHTDPHQAVLIFQIKCQFLVIYQVNQPRHVFVATCIIYSMPLFAS